jgi:uncharacterized protein YaaN involved in tellurite resistance
MGSESSVVCLARPLWHFNKEIPMGKLADAWKKTKDAAEKACKKKEKEGRKAEFPKFKSDFQKTLDKFESVSDSLAKLLQQVSKQQQELKTLGAQCNKIVTEYTQAINNAEVEGQASKEEVKGPMLGILKKIDTAVNEQVSNLTN